MCSNRYAVYIHSHWGFTRLLAAWCAIQIGKPVTRLLSSYRDILWWSSTFPPGAPSVTRYDPGRLDLGQAHCSLYTLVIRQHHLQVIRRTFGYWLPSHTNKQRPLVCLRAEVFFGLLLGYCDISVIGNELININIADNDKIFRDRWYASC